MPDSPDDPFISVIIPTWNRSARLEACVRELFGQTYPPHLWEVVIGDDGSTDDTREVAERLRLSAPVDVRIASGPHKGANAARNNGLAMATGEVFAFLDDDELAPQDHLRRIADHLRRRGDVAGVGGPYRDAGNSRIRTCAGCALGVSSLPLDRLEVVDVLIGGNMALRRTAVEETGPFDENLAGRGEETEWFTRADRSFLYDPALYILHRRDDTSLIEMCRRQFREGRGMPRSQRTRNLAYRPRPGRIPRLLAHSVRRRCGRGVIMAARELGATVGWLSVRRL